MAEFNMTPAVVAALIANQDPTADDSVDIDITQYVDTSGGTAIDDNGNVATDDSGTVGKLSPDSVIVENTLPNDVTETTPPPIPEFNTDGWVPVNYTYDTNGNFINLDPVDESLTPNFESDDILTSSDF